jgi:hypothetical protein
VRSLISYSKLRENSTGKVCNHRYFLAKKMQGNFWRMKNRVIIMLWSTKLYYKRGGEYSMKIIGITNVDKFLEVLDKCQGKIELITSEGDRLNLKSKLCQYLALSKIFSEAKIDEIEIVASEPEDTKLLLEYLIRG